MGSHHGSGSFAPRLNTITGRRFWPGRRSDRELQNDVGIHSGGLWQALPRFGAVSTCVYRFVLQVCPHCPHCLLRSFRSCRICGSSDSFTSRLVCGFHGNQHFQHRHHLVDRFTDDAGSSSDIICRHGGGDRQAAPSPYSARRQKRIMPCSWVQIAEPGTPTTRTGYGFRSDHWAVQVPPMAHLMDHQRSCASLMAVHRRLIYRAGCSGVLLLIQHWSPNAGAGHLVLVMPVCMRRQRQAATAAHNRSGDRNATRPGMDGWAVVEPYVPRPGRR